MSEQLQAEEQKLLLGPRAAPGGGVGELLQTSTSTRSSGGLEGAETRPLWLIAGRSP